MNAKLKAWYVNNWEEAYIEKPPSLPKSPETPK